MSRATIKPLPSGGYHCPQSGLSIRRVVGDAWVMMTSDGLRTMGMTLPDLDAVLTVLRRMSETVLRMQGGRA